MSIPNGHKAGCKCFPCRIHALTQERDGLATQFAAMTAKCDTAFLELDKRDEEKAAHAALINALTQERDNWMADFNKCADSLRDAEATIDRQAKIIANHQHASTKSESFALPAIILSVICGAMCGGVVAKHPAVPVAPWWLIVAGIILFVVVAAVAVLTMGAMSSSAASLDPPASGEEEAL